MALLPLFTFLPAPKWLSFPSLRSSLCPGGSHSSYVLYFPLLFLISAPSCASFHFSCVTLAFQLPLLLFPHVPTWLAPCLSLWTDHHLHHPLHNHASTCSQNSTSNCLTSEDGTNRLSQNVAKQLLTRCITTQQSKDFIHTLVAESLKSAWSECYSFFKLSATTYFGTDMASNSYRVKNTGSLKKMDGILNRYNLKSTGRIYMFGVLKCSEKFKVLDLP